MTRFRYRTICVWLGLLFHAVEACGVVVVTGEDVTSPNGIGGCIQIETTAGTYYLQKAGGSLASLVDKQGKDWIGHGLVPKDAGSWRGIPQANLIDFRPERRNGSSVIKSSNPTQVKVESKTDKGTALWTFYDTHVDWEVIEVKAVFTLSYEGAPYDDFSKSAVSYTLSDGTHNAISSGFAEDIKGKAGQGEWLYFSHEATTRGLLFVNHTDDNTMDYMGSLSHMTVFGFGRNGGGQNYVFDTTPQQFSIGLIEDVSVATAGAAAENWCAPAAKLNQ